MVEKSGQLSVCMAEGGELRLTLSWPRGEVWALYERRRDARGVAQLWLVDSSQPLGSGRRLLLDRAAEAAAELIELG